MAFISVRDINKNEIPPIVKFRQTKSGAGGGSISKSVPLRGERIDIQIDEQERKIRLGADQRGVSCNATGTFSCSVKVYQIIGDKRINLSDGGDGWWYGNY